MSVVGQLKTVIEVKASAAQIHEVFSCRPYIISSTNPERVQSCELIESEMGKEGFVIRWTLTRDGSDPRIAKELVELIYNETYITIYKLIEGSILKSYKSFYLIAKITPKDEGSLVYCTSNMRRRMKMFQILKTIVLQTPVDVTKNIDAYLLAHQQA